MSKQAGEIIEAATYAPEPEHLERLARYGERLVTGMLPIVRPPSGHHLPPEPTFERHKNWQRHQRDLSLTGLLVGTLNVDLLEGDNVEQLFLNLSYIFPRSYLVASRNSQRLIPIRTNGRSLFIEDHAIVGGVAHISDVFIGEQGKAAPTWAQNLLLRYQRQPWSVIQCDEEVNAVDALQQAISHNAPHNMCVVYNELAAEYGFINFRQFKWQQFQPTII